MAKVRKRSRGLSGTPSEHLNEATALLRKYTTAKIKALPCAKIPDAMFDMGKIVAHANEASKHSGTQNANLLLSRANIQASRLRQQARSCRAR